MTITIVMIEKKSSLALVSYVDSISIFERDPYDASTFPLVSITSSIFLWIEAVIRGWIVS